MVHAPPEERVRAYGRELFARLDHGGPVLFTQDWLDDRMMGLTTRNEALKVQLFRLVDTLPVLINDPAALSDHVRAYLLASGNALPGWIRAIIRQLPSSGLIARALAMSARIGATRMARKFIAGSNPTEVLKTVARLRDRRLAVTLDLLGEATVTEAEAADVQKQYLELIASLTEKMANWPEIPEIDRDPFGPIPKVNVSIKLSGLFSQFDPIDPEGTSRAVRDRLRPILRLARQRGAFVNFDMEQYSFKDTTLRIIRDILTEPEFQTWPDVGVAIQAYLTDTPRDLQTLRDWIRNERPIPLWVRLVKGAYWDFETIYSAQQGWPVPVYTRKWQSDACFEEMTRFLLSNPDCFRAAFGSHNIRSIAHAIATAEMLGLPPRQIEFQMLYGMADPIKETLQSLGQRVRVYTPYGQLLPGMAYLVRRLLENTSNESFLRASFLEHVNEEVLLMNPTTQAHRDEVASRTRSESQPTSPTRTFHNEPLADFSREESRSAMASALAAIKPQLGRDYPPIIDGQPVTTPSWIESRNPSHTRELVGRCGAATVEQARSAVAAAAKAAPDWADTPVSTRAQLLRSIAQGFRRRRFELSAWIIVETGKPWREADADVAEAIDFCDYYAEEMEILAQGSGRHLPGEVNDNVYQPRGVAVVIAPWNFPLAILTGMTTAALVTGNPVIMKPAEQSSVVAAKLMEVIREAGAPPGVVHYLPGIGEEIGPMLVTHPDVALVAFTGSVPVGLSINEAAAKTPPGQIFVRKVIAEMGGKNATIVDQDADLDEAVRGVVDAAFGYAGQKCSAGSRAIVVGSTYDTFVHRLIEAVRSLAVKPADDPGCAMGPVIDAESKARLERAIARGKSESTLAYEGDLGSLRDEGNYVAPHVFTNVTETSFLAQDELFGPVLAVMKATDLDDAIRIANGTKYALTGAFYSRNPEHITKVKRRLRVGNLYINRKCTGALVDRQPFGGFCLSGIGSKAGGPDYLLQFLVPRTITENTLRRGFAPTES